MAFIKKILAPTDCSEPSVDAMRFAIELAKQHQAHLIIFHVVSPPNPFVYTQASAIELAKSDSKTNVEKMVEEYWESLGETDIEPEFIIKEGDPFDKIMRYAKQKACNLIVMGTHGRTGIMHIMMGSVAEKVVRYSPIPVLTVKHRDYEYFPEPEYDYDVKKTY